MTVKEDNETTLPASPGGDVTAAATASGEDGEVGHEIVRPDTEDGEDVEKETTMKPKDVMDEENGSSSDDIKKSVTDDEDGDDKGEDGDDENEGGPTRVSADAPWSERMWEVFTTFWPLGLVAFGGPQAHVAILRDHLVVQRKWMDEEQFTELFAIGQGLPGPTSTQLVISTALSRAGPLGGLLAFFLWNLPGLIVLIICGVLLAEFIDRDDLPWWLAGLPPAAISLVFKAFYGFGIKLDKFGVCLALCSALVTILINNDARIDAASSQWVFPSMLAIGGLLTYIDHKRANPFSSYGSQSAGWDADSDELMKRIGIPLWVGALIFVVWAAMLVFSIVFYNTDGTNNVYFEIFSVMYRIGSIIFGGGQVVLPMLQDEVVPAWMSKDQFLTGLGLAQSMPGPLFNFSSYLGAVYKGKNHKATREPTKRYGKLPKLTRHTSLFFLQSLGVSGGLIAWLGLFGPGVILIFAIVPFWARLRHVQAFKAVLKGVNATAIGLVGAACVILWEAAVENAADAMVFCFSLTMAVVFAIQAPIVVIMGGIMGALLHEDVLNLGQQPYCVRGGQFVEV